MVTVHHFGVWNAVEDKWVYPPLKSPESRIRDEAHGEILPGTAKDVDASTLDELGRYDPSRLNKST